MFEELSQSGVNIEDAISRCMGNGELLEKLYRIFPDCIRKANVKESFETGNIDAAFSGAHMLKGMTGNLAMTQIFKAYCDIVEFLRNSEVDKAFNKYINMLPLQDAIVKVIEKYQ